MDKEAAINKIRALEAKGNDPTVTKEESELYLAKARELADKYNVKESDVDKVSEPVNLLLWDDIMKDLFKSYHHSPQTTAAYTYDEESIIAPEFRYDWEE